jgi:hypothetical protein
VLAGLPPAGARGKNKVLFYFNISFLADKQNIPAIGTVFKFPILLEAASEISKL